MPFELILRNIILNQKGLLSSIYQILMLEVVINDKATLGWEKKRTNTNFSVGKDRLVGVILSKNVGIRENCYQSSA